MLFWDFGLDIWSKTMLHNHIYNVHCPRSMVGISTAWSTMVLSAFCQSVTKGRNWHIDYLSLILFLSWMSGMYLYLYAPSSQILFLNQYAFQIWSWRIFSLEYSSDYKWYSTIWSWTISWGKNFKKACW